MYTISAIERPDATRRAISTFRDIAFVNANDCRELSFHSISISSPKKTHNEFDFEYDIDDLKRYVRRQMIFVSVVFDSNALTNCVNVRSPTFDDCCEL